MKRYGWEAVVWCFAALAIGCIIATLCVGAESDPLTATEDIYVDPWEVVQTPYDATLHLNVEEKDGELEFYWVADKPEDNPTIEAPTSVVIEGPGEVTAGSGKLLRLQATGATGEVSWLPMVPIRGLQQDYHFLEDDGKTWGCAVPAKPGTIEVQCIDWGSKSWSFAVVNVIGGQNDDGDGDDQDDDGDDEEPLPDRLVVLIIEETRDRGPDWGDVWNVLQRDKYMAKHALIIMDDDQSGLLNPYTEITDERPAIILDTDLDASEYIVAERCPATVDAVKGLVQRYTSTKKWPPELEITPDVEPRPVAPIPKRVETKTKKQPRYVWVTIDGKRWGRDNETGALYPVDETKNTFCTGDRCFKVPPR